MLSSVILILKGKECISWCNRQSHALKIKEPKVHIRHVMLWVFNKKKKAQPKQLRKWALFIEKMTLLTAKSKTGDTSLKDQTRLNQSRTIIRSRLRYYQRIDRIQSAQKYARNSILTLQIPINELPLLEKDRNSERLSNLAPRDFHLLNSLKNGLNDKRFFSILG